MRTLSLLVALACLGLVPAWAASDWCYDSGDWIYADVSQGTITVHHKAAFYNCGQDSIGYTWALEGGTFRVVETEYNPQALCYCCFDLTTTMRDVAPGPYLIDFYFNDNFHGWRHVYLDVTVPDEGQGGTPSMGGHTMSTCIPEAPSGLDPAEGVTVARLSAGGANPAGDRAALRLELPAPARVTLAIYSADGSLVRMLVDEDLGAGSYTTIWDGTDSSGRRAAHGVYFATASVGGRQSVRRVALIQ